MYFSLAESLIEFNQIAIATADGTGSENMLNRVMTKDNIAISALLQTKDGAFDPSNMPDPSFARQSIMVRHGFGFRFEKAMSDCRFV